MPCFDHRVLNILSIFLSVTVGINFMLDSFQCCSSQFQMLIWTVQRGKIIFGAAVSAQKAGSGVKLLLGSC